MGNPATVVSAFYVMNSKYPPGLYIQWIRQFLENIDCQLVFFTEEDMIPLFRECRKHYIEKTRFVALPREEWVAYTKYGLDFWNKQHSIDKEKHHHSPDLYSIWYEKKEFVKRAIDLNPFGSDIYIWCDAGAFRFPQWLPKLKHFGSYTQEIPKDKMVLLQVDEFTEADRFQVAQDGLGDFDNVNRVGGGIQAGYKDSWKVWSDLYDQKLQQRLDKGMFVGKDQTIMAALVLQNPDKVKMIPSLTWMGDKWFTLLFEFSGPLIQVLIPLYNGIEYLKETLESVAKQTYVYFEVVIGVNGWEPNSAVYQEAKKLVEEQKLSAKVLDLVECKGKPQASNAMLKYGTNEWIALLDADDVWHPQKLEAQVSLIQNFPGAFDVVSTKCVYFGESQGAPNLPDGDLSEFDFFSMNPIVNSSVLLRRSLAHWTEGCFVEDYDLWLRLRYQKKAKFYSVGYPLVHHRIHSDSAFNPTNANHVPELKKRLKAEFGWPEQA